MFFAAIVQMIINSFLRQVQHILFVFVDIVTLEIGEIIIWQEVRWKWELRLVQFRWKADADRQAERRMDHHLRRLLDKKWKAKTELYIRLFDDFFVDKFQMMNFLIVWLIFLAKSHFRRSTIDLNMRSFFVSFAFKYSGLDYFSFAWYFVFSNV